MGNVSLREAVKHFDVSRPTLLKALHSGKVSGVQDEKGQWSIDPSEIARVYRSRSSGTENFSSQDNDNLSSPNTSLEAEIHALRLQLAEADKRASVAEAERRAAEAERRAAEEIAEERGRRIEDLRRMLPAPNEAPKPAQGFWARVFGG